MYACLIGLRDAGFLLLQHGENPFIQDTNGHKGKYFSSHNVPGNSARQLPHRRLTFTLQTNKNNLENKQ